METDYKKYSLGKLKEWVHDALNTSEASPHEIYSTIREAVREDYYCYKDYANRAYGLLELLSGHRPVADFEYTGSTVSSVKQDKVVKWQLPIEADPSGEYFVTFPDDLLEVANLEEGDTVEWVDQGDGSYLLKKVDKTPSWVEGNELSKHKTYDEMIADGWEMTDDGFWVKEDNYGTK